MSWFRVDDGFHSHPKVLRAGNAAVGLWVRCGSYSSDQLLDGEIPGEIVRMYGTRKEIAALIDARMWSQNGAGFIIPDFLDFNPSAEQVTAQRAAAAERQRLARDKAKSQRESQRDGPVTNGEVTDAVTVPPTRPDPTPSSLTSSSTPAVDTRSVGVEDDQNEPPTVSDLLRRRA